ncbi:hypothetical protein Tsubulata_033985 [Turnera subulata]|uniref:Phytocyanin domain-containing protein n=1 Tax=Turnera subulata TaxID=218843 RepID=A0A9Q0FFC3_9ROSI|nr:hypothetical protein Tsubulata_033985 [Turnera subulata]
MKGFTVIVHDVLLCLLFLGWFLPSRAIQEEYSIGPMETKEKEALYSAIQGFTGKWWNGSELYPDPCGWTPIQGVSCDLFDGYWYVTTINIGPVLDNSLLCTDQAKFTHHLFELKHLRSLSFFNCFLSPRKSPTKIPSSNWELLANSLEYLEFRSNPGLIGTIPSTIGYLKQLQSLVLLENGLAGNLPEELGNLVNLKRLVLAGNKFTGQIPVSIGGLSQLLIFDSSGNFLSGSVPSTCGGLVSLLKLDLSNNMLEGKLPEEIGSLKNLTLLDLDKNNISGGLVKSLQELVSLKEMVVSNNPVGGDLMGIKWKDLQNLEILDLSSTGLRGTIPESLLELKRLRFLGLRDNNLSGVPPPRLATMPNIGALYIDGNNFTGRLEFPEKFYQRMGRRFAAGNNPSLCFQAESVSPSYFPYGYSHYSTVTSTSPLPPPDNPHAPSLHNRLPIHLLAKEDLTIMTSPFMGSSKIFLFVVLFSSFLFYHATSTEFLVGGEDGWGVPKKDEQTYNEWASRNRFKVNDTVQFVYKKDSVLVVTEEEYKKCRSSHPFFFSNNGDTEFTLDRPGLFYFISGVSGHCERGEKMIIKVLEPELIDHQSGNGTGGGSTEQKKNNSADQRAIESTVLILLCCFFNALFFV